MSGKGAALRQRVTQLRSSVKDRKRRIRRERRQLQSEAAKLAELEEECRKRGIGLTIIQGEGGIRGRDEEAAS